MLKLLSGESLERHQAFWSSERSDRPLLGINVGFSLQDLFPLTMAGIADGPLYPEDIPVERFLEDCEVLVEAHRDLGDYPLTIAPLVALPWMEAIAGCPIVASRNGIWAGHCVEDWRGWRWPESFLDNPWTPALLDLMDALLVHSAGRYLVSHTLMRGPSDILSALRGAQRFVLDLMDEREMMAGEIATASRLWNELATAQLARLPSSDEGYIAGAAALRCWSPTRALWLQEDAMSLLSPDLYLDCILPADRAISRDFPGLAFHLHGSALWAVDSLVELPGIHVIELNLEDANCDIEGTFAGWRKIQKHRPVIAWRMYGKDFEAWLDRVLEELFWDGLSVQVSTRNRGEAETVQRVFDQAIAGRGKRRKGL
jgi:hypothetical protein